jgi:hypothetical protein
VRRVERSGIGEGESRYLRPLCKCHIDVDRESQDFRRDYDRLSGNFISLSSMCHPFRGSQLNLDASSHRFRGGLRCAVPPGLLERSNRSTATVRDVLALGIALRYNCERAYCKMDGENSDGRAWIGVRGVIGASRETLPWRKFGVCKECRGTLGNGSKSNEYRHDF